MILWPVTPLLFVLVVGAISIGAGFFGSLLGLGGGLIVIPTLTLLLHVDIRLAIGASIVSVIATSSGAAAACTRAGRHLPTCARKTSCTSSSTTSDRASPAGRR